MGRLWVVALVAPLPGCLPPALTLASFAADGASYAASRKTVADHGISLATARDCAIIARLIDEKPICLDRLPDASVPVEDRRRPPLFLIVGSFAERGNAEREAQRYSGMGTAIVPATVGGRLLHRVVVGPVTVAQAAALGPETWKAPR
jgi:hypothetical protein